MISSNKGEQPFFNFFFFFFFSFFFSFFSHEMNELSKTAIGLLAQSIDLIENTLTDNEQFIHESKVMPSSTIGKHLRHLCDHFELLYKQVSVLNYDKRDRNTPAENDRWAAKERIVEIQKTIEENSKISLETPLVLSATIDANDSQQYQFQSSFGRELFYCSIHAVSRCLYVFRYAHVL
jgi:hypothetical protein